MSQLFAKPVAVHKKLPNDPLVGSSRLRIANLGVDEPRKAFLPQTRCRDRGRPFRWGLGRFRGMVATLMPPLEHFLVFNVTLGRAIRAEINTMTVN